MFLSISAPAQQQLKDPVHDQAQPTQPSTLDRTLTTLHGVVRSAATGEGLPRALVRIEGDANTGALTDGEGRFEIPNIPVGPQSVGVRKPGFRDLSNGGAAAAQGDQIGPTHNVMVAAEMPDVVFTLAPTGTIRGQVELSTGDTAEGTTITLARRAIMDGRTIWQVAGGTKTRSDGTFRFGGLADGEYAIFSEPTMDSDLDGMPGGAGQRWGYASVYYPDAREPSGAARIRVANGGETTANLSLTLEPFQSVTAVAVFPQGSAAGRVGVDLSAVVMDSAGHQVPYQTQYDVDTHTIQALLPDGTYSMLVSTVPRVQVTNLRVNVSTGTSQESDVLAGTADFAVAGHAVPRLRIPLSAPHPSPVQVTVVHNAAQSTINQNEIVTVMVSKAGGWIDDIMVSGYANGPVAGPLTASYTVPGTYWVHTHVSVRGLCEASFTAGGASLAREPVRIGLSGSTAPMDLTLRDDCAALQLSLPETLASITAGEEPFFTVYVVPDFDSTADVEPVTLRPSTGGNITLNGLTPGSYHVYTLAGAAQLAYRNREALAALKNPGQAITLSPGTTGSLVVEAVGQ
ncbi:MAG TPA: carboxypeptidase regulatory-like domain-containing protein [Terracidiphilus sp.]|nr:carboxypeptidase regulatory-like domain-containing protein [Terracidiphilus sp.]